jgi:hypothetical protein
MLLWRASQYIIRRQCGQDDAGGGQGEMPRCEAQGAVSLTLRHQQKESSECPRF